MTELQRDIQTEELLARSRRLREELSGMLLELEDYVVELDHFVAALPRSTDDRTTD